MSQTTRAISGLYAITAEFADTEKVLRRVRLALQGGTRVLQYRAKSANAELRARQARELRQLTGEFSVPLIINDDARLAIEVEADGVHLGRADGAVDAARGMPGPQKIIGVSCYNRTDLARQAVAAGADYVAFGAFYPSRVKPGAVHADIALLRQARSELGVPIVAIGGITVQNGAALIEAGAHALAVISAVFDAPDVACAAQEFTELFGQDKT